MQLRQIAMFGGFALALLCPPAFQAAKADAASCAATVASPNPPSVTAGAPCWTDVQPYPFGADGEPVDTNSPQCATAADGPDSAGVTATCYLTVESMAFRAWNRGLALMASGSSPGAETSPYDVWEYNGTDWVPNASYPSSSCAGSTILWAGKLDYWVVGDQTGASWPALCRWDGSTLEWDVLPVPAAAVAAATSGITASPNITSGACFAWNNCWFVGSDGVKLHWDGTALADVANGLGASPWLDGDLDAASAFTDASGNQYGFAVGQVATNTSSVPAQPDGSPPPQVFESTGGAFQPSPIEPATVSDSLPADQLVALGFNPSGSGWIAGNSVSGDTGAAPLIPITEAGASPACPAITAATFPASDYDWSSVGVLPDGDALAAGKTGDDGNDDQPVIVDASCATGPTQTLFTVPDPTQQSSAPVPADAADGGSAPGEATSVVVNADNDAWAATTPGGIPNVDGGNAAQAPHLYHFTDGQTPDAPAGDDDEARTIAATAQPTLYETPPTVVIPPAPAPNVTEQTLTRLTIKLPSPIYRVKLGSPVARGDNRYTLTLSFRVRRTVTIGVDALRHGHVVARSGLHKFRQGRGHLTLKLRRTAWPTGLKFVLPKLASQ